MITKLKRKDVGKLVGDNIYSSEIYYALDQAADKLRAIYVLFGWSHMTGEMSQADDTIMSLVSYCATSLIDNPKSHSSKCSTAGCSVEMAEDEYGFIEIGIDFKIIS